MTRVLADRYELGQVIGAGGMARVVHATDRVLGRRVAVKLLDDAAAESADPANRRRFLEEARSAASFSHPNAVAIYDAGEDDGVLFIVLELVEGESLAARMAREVPLPIAEAVRIAVHVLDALEAMHAAGIVHRDVKPANVLLDGTGRVKLTDFGIAKRLDEIDEALTTAGTVIGTPQYLAPEQAVGDTVGPRTDVYLTGAVLHEMLTGRRPPSVIARTADDLPSLRRLRPELPGAVDEAVTTSLARRPTDRFASAAAMAEALRASGLDAEAMPPAAAHVDTSPRTDELPAQAPTVTATMPLPVSDDPPTSLEQDVPSQSSTSEVAATGPVDDDSSIEPTTRTEPTEHADRPSRAWMFALALAVVIGALAGLAITAARDDGASRPVADTEPPPADGLAFLAALRADPDRFGDRGEDLLDELEAVLAESDSDRRDQAIEELRVDIFVWVAEGDLDTSVGGLVDDLLDE